MRKPLLHRFAISAVFMFCSSVAAQDEYAPYPAPDAGYITDLADLLDAEVESQLEQHLYDAEEQTGVEIAVLTIQSIDEYPRTNTRDIESFAEGVFNAWGIGNMPANNGVLLVVAARDRKARIELGRGYTRSRDADASRIMNNTIVPYFRKDDYAGGIRAGVTALISDFTPTGHAELTTSAVPARPPLTPPVQGPPQSIPPSGTPSSPPIWIFVMCVIVAIVLAIVLSLLRSGTRGWGWTATRPVLHPTTRFLDDRHRRRIDRHSQRRRTSGFFTGLAAALASGAAGGFGGSSSNSGGSNFGGGFGGGFSSGGGGGSFGGGSSGGSGATGSW